MKHALAATVVVGFGLLAAGCGSSHRSTPAPLPTQSTSTSQQETSEMVASWVETSEFTSMAVQSVMAQVDPAQFSASGDGVASVGSLGGGSGSGSGTIRFDFGTGRTIANTTFVGVVDLSWTVSGGSGVAVLAFSNFSVASPGHTVALSGTLTCALTINGSRATAVVSGSLTTIVDGVVTSLTSSYVYDLDGPTGRVDVTGTGTLIHSQAGTWTATLAGVRTELVGGQRAVTAGTVTLTRTLPFPGTAIYQFTAPNAGSYTVVPPGLSGSFSF